MINKQLVVYQFVLRQQILIKSHKSFEVLSHPGQCQTVVNQVMLGVIVHAIVTRAVKDKGQCFTWANDLINYSPLTRCFFATMIHSQTVNQQIARISCISIGQKQMPDWNSERSVS